MIYWLKKYFYRKFKTSFSKSGEDIQLMQLLKKSKGFYIDIGGHHPIFSSNSYFFYLRGWRGIVVEPNPIFKSLYKKFRPEDFLYSGGVSSSDGILEYFNLDGNERNTFSSDYLRNFKLEEKVINSMKLPVKKLSTLISEYSPSNPKIDFLCIDVEGMELEVLKSNDWEKYRPSYILLESHLPIEEEIDSIIFQYLKGQEYKFIGKSLQGFHLGTLWFRSNETEFKN